MVSGIGADLLQSRADGQAEQAEEGGENPAIV